MTYPRLVIAGTHRYSDTLVSKVLWSLMREIEIIPFAKKKSERRGIAEEWMKMGAGAARGRSRPGPSPFLRGVSPQFLSQIGRYLERGAP